MRFDCNKPDPRQQWHRWFAWKPVEVDKHDCRWLEVVERRVEYKTYGFYMFQVWHYRPVTKE